MSLRPTWPAVLVMLAAVLLAACSPMSRDRDDFMVVETALQADGRVWLHTTGGALISAQPRVGPSSTHYRHGVVAIALGSGGLLVLREAGSAQALVVTQLQDGRAAADSPVLRLPAGETPYAFFTASDGAYILSRTSLSRLSGGRWITRRLSGEGWNPWRAMGRTGALVVGRTAHLSLDAGEFGGPLQDLDLDTGVLGPEYGPAHVTGMVADPQRPGCLIVSVGLFHMAGMGEVDRVCGRRTESVLVVQGNAQGSAHGETEPFTGVAVRCGVVWAVNRRGAYRLDRPNAPPRPPPAMLAFGGDPFGEIAPGLWVVRSYLAGGPIFSRHGALLVVED